MVFSKVKRARKKLFSNRRSILLRLPVELCAELDGYSQKHCESRTAIIKQAIESKLERESQ